MNSHDTAVAVKAAVIKAGGAFMIDRETSVAGKALGLRTLGFYFGGRGGALGVVDADVVAAAMTFFPPDHVRELWNQAAAVLPPTEVAVHYAGACHTWGRANLGAPDLTPLERLCTLAERVIAAADPAGRPLFAAWRAMPMPDDPPARAAHLLHLLREHRGGSHALAVLASELSPLQAIVAGPHGTAHARFFGWPEPYPDAAPLLERWQTAEEITDRLVAVAYGALSEDEGDELATLLGATRAAAVPASLHG